MLANSILMHFSNETWVMIVILRIARAYTGSRRHVAKEKFDRRLKRRSVHVNCLVTFCDLVDYSCYSCSYTSKCLASVVTKNGGAPEMKETTASTAQNLS